MDTRFPFILFVSQAETEDVLNGWLRGAGVMIERGTELLSFERKVPGSTASSKEPMVGRNMWTRDSS